MIRTSLAARLQQGKPLLCPGVYDAFSAALAEQAGFEAVYLSGASIAYTQLGAPDIGLVAMTEAADVCARVRDRVALPVVVDADTGFGNALNVQRTVRLLERAGASAIQLEDQSFPKRCGHLTEKTLVPMREMVGKLRAALDVREQALIIARTDAIAVEGFAAALDRAEAPADAAQVRAVAARFAGRIPLMANMVEGGVTPMFSLSELGAVGFNMVIFPGGTVRAVAKQLQSYFASLHQFGSTVPFRDRMLDFAELNGLLGTKDILQAGRRYEQES